MNRHGKKEQLTSVHILCQITIQNAPYMDYKLLVLMSFEVTTVTSMDSQEPPCCDDATRWLLNEVGSLPYKGRFGSAKFNSGWNYKCMAVRLSFTPHS